MQRMLNYLSIALVLVFTATAWDTGAIQSDSDLGATEVSKGADSLKRGKVVHHVSVGGTDTCEAFGLKAGCDGNFSLTAMEDVDGNVRGQFQDTFKGFGGAIHGTIDCLVVEGNRAVLSGIVTKGVTDPAFFYYAEGRRVMLNVRIATPPWDRKANDWMKVNPGVASSYIFNQKIGDTVTVSGPYGEFFIKETDAEMLYIGGGAGMAPMRSHLYHLFRTLKTNRKVSYWYGGRSKRELFYIDHFKALEKDFPNFKFYMVLSEPLEEDNWKVKDGLDGEGDGFVGFVHQAVIDNYLSKHEAPEDIEYYFCGPPMMNQAVIGMVDDFGVPPENVSFDDFGG